MNPIEEKLAKDWAIIAKAPPTLIDRIAVKAARIESNAKGAATKFDSMFGTNTNNTTKETK